MVSEVISSEFELWHHCVTVYTVYWQNFQILINSNSKFTENCNQRDWVAKNSTNKNYAYTNYKNHNQKF